MHFLQKLQAAYRFLLTLQKAYYHMHFKNYRQLIIFFFLTVDLLSYAVFISLLISELFCTKGCLEINWGGGGWGLSTPKSGVSGIK
jgi:hypothetical protein